MNLSKKSEQNQIGPADVIGKINIIPKFIKKCHYGKMF